MPRTPSISSIKLDPLAPHPLDLSNDHSGSSSPTTTKTQSLFSSSSPTDPLSASERTPLPHSYTPRKDEYLDDDDDEDGRNDHETEGRGLLRKEKERSYDLSHSRGHGSGRNEFEFDEMELEDDDEFVSEPLTHKRTRSRSASLASLRMSVGMGMTPGGGFASSHGEERKSVGWEAVDRKFLKEMFAETLPISLLSLVGIIFSGELLNRLSGWRVFIQIEELFILVPILQNLKGNLEMVLAARFSTSANIGELDVRRTRQALLLGNLTLLQVQALIVSLVSGIIAFVLGVASRNGVKYHRQNPNEGIKGGYFEGIMVLCASMLAAGLSSAILGGFMCGLVIICRWKRINPDNVATPVAGALGDLITLTILAMVASGFLSYMGTITSTIVFLLLVAWIGLNFVLTWKNAYTQELLGSGWSPLFGAMIVSSGTGFVLEKYANKFEGFPLFSLVVTGLCGNLGAIFVSRLTTSLHSSRPEPLVPLATILFILGFTILVLFYLFAVITSQLPPNSISWSFFLAYVISNAFSLMFTFVWGNFLTQRFWRWGYDPDVYALPILTSVVDCIAQGLLVVVFKMTAEETMGVGSEEGDEMGERTIRLLGRFSPF